MARLRPSLLILIVLLVIPACTPRISLSFRDYETPSGVSGSDALERVQAALADAGWQLADAPVDSTIRTERRTLSNWGLYRVTAYVEAVPLRGDYVRVFFHPYREYVTGGQSKIPYLARSLRSGLVRPLEASLKEQGLHLPGSRPKAEIEAFAN